MARMIKLTKKEKKARDLFWKQYLKECEEELKREKQMKGRVD